MHHNFTEIWHNMQDFDPLYDTVRLLIVVLALASLCEMKHSWRAIRKGGTDRLWNIYLGLVGALVTFTTLGVEGYLRNRSPSLTVYLVLLTCMWITKGSYTGERFEFYQKDFDPEKHGSSKSSSRER